MIKQVKESVPNHQELTKCKILKNKSTDSLDEVSLEGNKGTDLGRNRTVGAGKIMGTK